MRKFIDLKIVRPLLKKLGGVRIFCWYTKCKYNYVKKAFKSENDYEDIVKVKTYSNERTKLGKFIAFYLKKLEKKYTNKDVIVTALYNYIFRCQ